jgi:dihydroflavonol-4-reductase
MAAGEKRVLITGGTGFIGSRLTRLAQRRAASVFVLTRQPESPAARQLGRAGARLLLGDVCDREQVQAAIEVARPSLVVHLAGWYELGIPRSARRRMRNVNVDGVENVLSRAAEAGVGRVVHVSSTTALGDTGGAIVDETFVRRSPPVSWYEATKAEGHSLALRHQAAGEPVVIAAPAQVVGPGDASPFGIMARLFLRGRMPPLAWGPEAAFSFAHVDDVVEGLWAVGERGKTGETYFLAGNPMTVRELMNLWGGVEGRRPVRLWLPRSLALAQAALMAPLLRATGRPAFISPEVVRSGSVSFRYSSRKVVGDLGVKIRPAEQAWADTLRAEAEIIRPGRSEARR